MLSLPDSVSHRGAHALTGVLLGGVIGAVAGNLIARHDAAHCGEPDCGSGPPLQFIAYPVLLGITGMVAGGIVGLLWPPR